MLENNAYRDKFHFEKILELNSSICAPELDKNYKSDFVLFFNRYVQPILSKRISFHRINNFKIALGQKKLLIQIEKLLKREKMAPRAYSQNPPLTLAMQQKGNVTLCLKYGPSWE